MNRREDCTFPSKSNEVFCRFVGFLESVGHAMTYKVLTTDTKKILYRLRVRHANKLDNLCARQPHPNLLPTNGDNNKTTNPDEDDQGRVFDPGGSGNLDTPTEFIHTRKQPMAVLDPNDIIGRTYLSTPEEDGTRMRLRVVEAIDEVDRNLNNSDAK